MALLLVLGAADSGVYEGRGQGPKLQIPSLAMKDAYACFHSMIPILKCILNRDPLENYYVLLIEYALTIV